MESLLTAVETRVIASNEQSAPLLTEKCITVDSPPCPIQQIKTPDEALEALRSKPNLQTLSKALQYLDQDVSDFRIQLPGPKAALLVGVLVGTIIPDYWASLYETNERHKRKRNHQRDLRQEIILRCLRSVAGLGAILAQLRSLIALARDSTDKTASLGMTQRLTSLLDVLASVILPDYLLQVWNDINLPRLQPIQRTLLWKELISLVASGRIPSISAEATDIINAKTETVIEESWLASSNQYSVWLGKQITSMASRTASDDEGCWMALAQLLGKSYSLGYTGTLLLLILDVGAQDMCRYHNRGNIFWSSSGRC